MSAVALADAYLALLPDDVQVFDGQVPRGADGELPTPPWVYVTVSLPDVAERAMSRASHAYTIRARCLIYAGTATGVRIIADKVAAAEGVRPVAAGWSTSPVERLNEREPVEDRDVVTALLDRHPMYGVLEHLFTATRTA